MKTNRFTVLFVGAVLALIVALFNVAPINANESAYDETVTIEVGGNFVDDFNKTGSTVAPDTLTNAESQTYTSTRYFYFPYQHEWHFEMQNINEVADTSDASIAIQTSNRLSPTTNDWSTRATFPVAEFTDRFDTVIVTTYNAVRQRAVVTMTGINGTADSTTVQLFHKMTRDTDL